MELETETVFSWRQFSGFLKPLIKEEIGKADLNGYVGEGNRSDEEVVLRRR